MIKILWDFSSKIFENDSREKLIIIFVFILGLCILFTLGKEGMELLGVIIGGFFTFLRGIPSKKEDTELLGNLVKEKEQLQKSIIVEEPKVNEKEKIFEGEQL